MKKYAMILILLWGYLHAADYHISPSGNDAAGDGSQGKPWKTLRFACTKVAENAGHRIVMSAGTFTETGQASLPAGVDLVGAGVGKTIVTATPAFYHAYMGDTYALDNFIIRAGIWHTRSNGNQKIHGFSIDGKNRNIYGGLYVRNRDRVEIFDLEVYETYFTGIWVWTTSNSSIHHVSFRNCSWGSEGYVTGVLNLSELVDVDVYSCTINEGQGGGRGFRSIGSSGEYFTRVRFFDNVVNVYHFGAWQGGRAPNMSFEIWAAKLEDCEIFNNTVNNTISIVDGYHPPRGVKTVRVHHNNILISDTQGYPLELSVHDCEIDNNYIYGGNGSVMIAQWEWTQGYENWNIHHNYFVWKSFGYPNSIIFARKGCNNIRFENNTVDIAGPESKSLVWVEHGRGDNIYIQNNIFRRSVPRSGGYLFQDATVELHTGDGSNPSLGNLTIRNNIFDGFPENVVVRGAYSNNSYAVFAVGNRTVSGNLAANPQWTATGNRPTPYYTPKPGSPAIDAGLDLGYSYTGAKPDIGAGEAGLLPDVPAPRPDPVDTVIIPEPEPEPEPIPADPVGMISINAGGDNYGFYVSDRYYSPGSNEHFTTEPIAGTDADSLYQTERWGPGFSYDVPVIDGTYDIILHFAEIYTTGITAPGQRVFDVQIEGQPALTNYDIFGKVGANFATSEKVRAECTDGVLNIVFSPVVENPKISAIEIAPAADTNPEPPEPKPCEPDTVYVQETVTVRVPVLVDEAMIRQALKTEIQVQVVPTAKQLTTIIDELKKYLESLTQ